MSESFSAGLGFALVSGIASGGCMLPMKLQRRWKWENFWLVFSVVALVLIPWSLALLLIPKLHSVYSSLRAGQFAAPVLFGAAWGFAQILFGLTIARLGLALSYAIIMGCVAVLGTVVPLVFLGGSRTPHPLVWLGLAIMTLGIALSGLAGRLKERAADRDEAPRDRVGGRYSAVLLAIACGVVSPMLNFAFAFARDILDSAVRFGARSTTAGFAVWPVALTAGFVPNLVYCLYLLRKNKTWGLFRSGFPDSRLALATAVLWMGSLATYGMSTSRLGNLGTSLGWGIVQALALITAGVGGVLTKEWTRIPRATRRLQSAGLSLLIVATVLMATGMNLSG